MAILSKGINFSTGEQVTADKLDALVDSAAFVGGAVDNSTTQLSGGAIIVKDSGITTNKIASGVNINFNDGSAASPSITNNGDTNTGIFFPADNTIGLSVDGVEKVRLNEGGSMIAKGDLYGYYLFLPAFNTDPFSNASRLEIRKDTSNPIFRIETYSDGTGIVNNLFVGTDRGSYAFFHTNGNVGIGNTSPNNKLDVSGNISVPEGVLKPIVRANAQFPSGVSSIEFTSIPDWVKRITVTFITVNTNNTGNFLIQIGDSDGIETANYAAGVSDHGGFLSNTSGFLVTRSGVTTAGSVSGVVTIVNAFNNYWNCAGNIVSNTVVSSSAGTKNLSSTLDRLRISILTGTFVSGGFNIMYE